MHFEVSMSLASEGLAATRTPGGGCVVAERRTISRDWSGMLELLHPHEERLVLGRLRVGISHRRGERIRHVARLRKPGEPPMDGDADVVDRLARDLQRLQALRDYGDRLDVAAVRFHLHPIARLDPELAR